MMNLYGDVPPPRSRSASCPRCPNGTMLNGLCYACFWSEDKADGGFLQDSWSGPVREGYDRSKDHPLEYDAANRLKYLKERLPDVPDDILHRVFEVFETTCRHCHEADTSESRCNCSRDD